MGNIFGAQRQPTQPLTPQGQAQQLRRQGDEASKARHQASERSKAAYTAGDHAAAKYWSQQAKAHAQRAERLHGQAAEMTYGLNNAGRPDTEVDLHGLRVAEAIRKAETAIVAARQRGNKRLVLIVGRGLHSRDGVAKLKPAVVRELVHKHSLRCTPGVPNEGCVLVELVPPEQRGWLGALLSPDGGCVVC